MSRIQNRGNDAGAQATADKLFAELSARRSLRVEDQHLLREDDVAPLLLNRLKLSRIANEFAFGKIRKTQLNPGELDELDAQRREKDELIAGMQQYVMKICIDGEVGEPKWLDQVYM